MTFIPHRPCLNRAKTPRWKVLLSRLTRGFYLPIDPPRCWECQNCLALQAQLMWLARMEDE